MTNTILQRCIFMVLIMLLLSVAIALWLQTPQLFSVFNQAFCPH